MWGNESTTVKEIVNDILDSQDALLDVLEPFRVDSAIKVVT